jgi:hypothetical protein
MLKFQKPLIAYIIILGACFVSQVSGQIGPEYLSSVVPPLGADTLAWRRLPIESFAWPTSVRQGETVALYTSILDTASHGSYYIKLFRMGSSSPLTTLGPFTSHFYPLRAGDGTYIYPGDTTKKPVDFKLGCSSFWASSMQTFQIPSEWASGIYYAIMVFSPATADTGTAYFVVRSSSPGSTSKILLKYPVTTDQAYNYWGGGSLYSPTQNPTLTCTDSIAMDRPIREDFAHDIRAWSVQKYFLMWAEANGYTLEYCNNIDIDQNQQGFLSNYKTVVHIGHDEYWSFDERRNTDHPINGFKGQVQHGNLIFLAANTCYWRIYWVESSPGTTDYKRLKCKKGLCAGSAEDLWRAGNNANPEAFFIGSQYERGYTVRGNATKVMAENHWIYRGTGLHDGELFGFGDT